MIFVYFAVWILLCGRFSLDVLATGAGISLLIYLFTWRVIGLTPKKELETVRKIPSYILYVLRLIREVIKANLQVAGMILDPTSDVEPQLITLHTKLKERSSRVLLANSITLTPGTITAYMKDDVLIVHALDKETAEGLADGAFEKELLSLEEERV
ncbi:MAG: Na+/H+ antiporter subunit E [Clostridia bacterium]|nr:Na+/H+ antiporter subunit E [Clostridia bacterium]